MPGCTDLTGYYYVLCCRSVQRLVRYQLLNEIVYYGAINLSLLKIVRHFLSDRVRPRDCNHYILVPTLAIVFICSNLIVTGFAHSVALKPEINNFFCNGVVCVDQWSSFECFLLAW